MNTLSDRYYNLETEVEEEIKKKIKFSEIPSKLIVGDMCIPVNHIGMTELVLIGETVYCLGGQSKYKANNYFKIPDYLKALDTYTGSNPIHRIDWVKLREQKAIIQDLPNTVSQQSLLQAVDGLVNLIDSIQDYAADSLGFGEETVFGKSKNEEEE